MSICSFVLGCHTSDGPPPALPAPPRPPSISVSSGRRRPTPPRPAPGPVPPRPGRHGVAGGGGRLCGVGPLTYKGGQLYRSLPCILYVYCHLYRSMGRTARSILIHQGVCGRRRHSETQTDRDAVAQSPVHGPVQSSVGLALRSGV